MNTWKYLKRSLLFYKQTNLWVILGTIVSSAILIGALIIGVINNGMSILGAGPATQGIIKGLIIFSAVAADVVRRR